MDSINQEIKAVVGLQGLRKALQQTKGTIASKDVQVLLHNYLLSGNAASGTITLLATDLDLASIGSCQASVSSDFKIAVPGIKLIQIINSTDGDTIDFVIRGNTLTASIGRFKCELQCLSADDFPPFPDLDSSSFSSVSRDLFLAHLRRISFSINDNVVKKNLLAVRISDGYVQASDGKVTTICKCPLAGKIDKLTIPAMAVTDLIAVLAASEEQDLLISISDAFLVFKIGDSRFLARKSTAQFPDVMKLVVAPTEGIKNQVSFDRLHFKEAIQRVSVAADEKSYAIFVELHKDFMLIHSQDITGNKAEEQIDCLWDGQDNISYKFNYTYLLDICGSLLSDSVSLKLPESLRLPVRFEDSDFLCFLMRLAV